VSEKRTRRPHAHFRSRAIALTLLITFCLALVAPGAASARDSSARKLGRGVSNLSLGVLAIPGQMMDTTEESGPFIGTTWGFVKGVSYMVATEVVGVFELLTCPFETPPGYVAIMKPEFPWEYFTERRATRR